MSTSAFLPSLHALPLPSLEAFCADLGQPAFRARQLFQWLWQKGVADFAAMSNLSKSFREDLARRARLGLPEIADQVEAADGTMKLLLRLADGELIETVLLPEADHFTQCLSTQVGCAMGCTFCATGTLGFRRNLDAGEIAAQALLGRRLLTARGEPRHLRNLVYMGMGEPLLNLGNTLDSLRILTHELGMDFSPRRVTVSTVGLPSGLRELGESKLCSLAVSLHAPTQAMRERIMPRAAAAFPLEALLPALEAYPLAPRQRITFEYVLLGGVNDQPGHARDLVRLLSHFKGSAPKINLIPCNMAGAPEGVAPYAPPTPEDVERFSQILRDKGFTAMRRASKGADIAAACGQLRAAATNAPPG